MRHYIPPGWPCLNNLVYMPLQPSKEYLFSPRCRHTWKTLLHFTIISNCPCIYLVSDVFRCLVTLSLHLLSFGTVLPVKIGWQHSLGRLHCVLCQSACIVFFLLSACWSDSCQPTAYLVPFFPSSVQQCPSLIYRSVHYLYKKTHSSVFGFLHRSEEKQI